MSNDVKQVRKVARAISTFLETEGLKVKATKVMDLIKDKDLSDINVLKSEVVNDMRTPAAASEPKAAAESNRKQRIETFMVANWASIKDNAEVKSALINAYCQGRYNKAKRTEMMNDLLSRCEPGYVPQVVPVVQPTVAADDLADDATAALAGALLGDEPKADPKTDGGAKYDF